MLIIGVDYRPSDQYIAFADTQTGECGERRLSHREGEAEGFYRELAARVVSVHVGMEATGYARWFERLLAELGIELWIGDAVEIKTRRVRKQKTDRNDATLLLKLLLENNFPRIRVPSPENRHLRQLVWHRHRLVQMRTRIMNQLQALTMCLRAGHWNPERFPCGKQIGSYVGLIRCGRFQCRPSAFGTHHQARQLTAALLASGGGQSGFGDTRIRGRVSAN